MIEIIEEDVLFTQFLQVQKRKTTEALLLLRQMVRHRVVIFIYVLLCLLASTEDVADMMQWLDVNSTDSEDVHVP